MSPSPLWPVVLAAAAALQFPAVPQTCISDEVQAGTRVVRTEARGPTGPWWREASPGHRRAGQKMETTPQPIRIRGWISRESSGLSEAERRVVEAAVGEAVGRVSGFLSVDRGPAPLLLNRDAHKYCKFVWRNSSSANYNRCARANTSYRRETCLDVTVSPGPEVVASRDPSDPCHHQIPDDHLAGCSVYPEAESPRRTELRPDGAGVPDADFLLYLHIKSTDKCRAEANVLAYAVHCQTGNRGRPVAGVVVICKDRLAGGTYSHQSTVQAHLVSTDPELGAPLENLVNLPTLGLPMSRMHPALMFSVLPCQGAAPGRASSHWESRVLRGSIMAPVLGDPVTVRIDPVTLAALQDTGWYTVDLSRAQSLVWGSGKHFHLGFCLPGESGFSLVGCKTWRDSSLHGLDLPIRGGQIQSSRVKFKPGFTSYQAGNAFTRVNVGKRKTVKTPQTQTVWLNSTVEGRCYRHRCTGPNRYQVQVFGSGWVDCPAGGAIQVAARHEWTVTMAPFSAPMEDCASAQPRPLPLKPLPRFPPPSQGSPPSYDGTGPHPGAAAAAALCVAAAVVVLAAAAFSRKWISCGVRIHSPPGDPADV
ncbi:Leishmanolysin-like peptidase [Takifugu flavidus]|uniref:Leishmanolysin-like peptidase n=1 Tax=Takifugu flavidus TaxID=433684 RepID=A0A5C6NCM1_9TELE|nr:Leishmanolysin-like peptidase [Takifugu flavidus]